MGITLGRCIVLIALWDWLFYLQPVGWTAGLFFFAMLVVVCLSHRRPRRSLQYRLTIAAILGLVAALVEHPSPIALASMSAAVISLAVGRTQAFRVGSARWLSAVGRFMLWGWMRFAGDLRLSRRWHRSHAGRGPGQKRSVTNWSIAVILSLVFVGLFSVANPVITDWIERLGDAIERTFEVVTAKRILLWAAVFLWAWALLRGRVGRRRPQSTSRTEDVYFAADSETAADLAKPDALPPPPSLPSILNRLDPHLVIRCLIAFNTVFLVQTLLDVVYLFLGADLPAHLTYAQYAHRGAYPLLATALLAGLFVLVTFRPHSHTQADTWCRRLVYLWLAQNVFLMFNSVWRLGLYIEVYSLTRWRVAALVWMALVGVGLAWVAWRIVSDRGNAWLIRANTLTTVAVIYLCAFVNFDRLIADFNVRHCHEITGQGAPLDLMYLRSLGSDSLPALVWLEEQTRDQRSITQQQVNAASTCSRPIDQRAAKVIECLKRELHDDLSDWRGWSYRRARLADSYPATSDAAPVAGLLHPEQPPAGLARHVDGPEGDI